MQCSSPSSVSSLAQLPFPNRVHSLSAIAVGAKNGPRGEGKEPSRVRGGTPERQDAGVKEGGSANDSSPMPSPLLLKRN